MKVVLAQINPVVGALRENRQKIVACIEKARQLKASLIVFPEMALCGYPPEDLLLLKKFIDQLFEELKKIIPASKGMSVIVGTARENPIGGEKGLYNSAAILDDGKLMGFQDKMLLPNYDVFAERRYFEPSDHLNVWSLLGRRVAVTICEDIWQHTQAVEDSFYLRDPVKELEILFPDLLINLSASPYHIQRYETRVNVCSEVAKTLNCPVLLCNQVGGNDRLVFDGYSMHVNPLGELVQHAKGFEEDLLLIDLEKQYTPVNILCDPTEDLFKALVLGIRDYFHKLGLSKCCFGLSGGVDSSVVACIAKKALGVDNVLALSLPSRYSSEEGKADARQLAHNLGIGFKEISIDSLFGAFLEVLTPHFEGKKSDVTEENLQARIRAVILMAFSNKFGYLLLATGNKSEIAMGYATLYGDMCGGVGVLSDVSKQRVYDLARYINREQEVIPSRIFDRPPSAELRLNQKDTDSLPEYAIVDLVLSEYIEEYRSPEEIAKKHRLPLALVKELVHKIHLNEYKRQQAPPGLRVTKRSFSIGRRFPIVQRWDEM